MNFFGLNPFVRSVSLYESSRRSGERIAYDARLIYMISGDLTYEVFGIKKGHLTPGGLLYIPAGVKYSLRGNYLRALVINFDLDGSYSDQTELIAPVPPEEFDEKKLHACPFAPLDAPILLTDIESERDGFLDMYHVFVSGEGFYRERISARLKTVLLKLCESVSDSALPSRMADELDAYIRENCSDEISNTEIGAIFGYHPFYVSRLIKEKKGVTLHQYIIAHRLKIAKSYLETTKKSIADIAVETGFTDASYFTKSFKGAFGISPKDYRASFKEEFI
jgi:AraC-like DNA-binding protein